MRTKVKFCGMTRQKDILLAEELHADFIGFIFVSSSPRSISLDEADRVRASISKVRVVGVFGEHSHDEIERYAKKLDLDFIQLHGEPTIDRIKNLSKPVIQAFRGVPDQATIEEFLNYCPYILIDKAEGGDQADFDAVAALPSSIREKLFLAGGLTPGNVRMAADRIQPYAVDCARGIESKPGIKNPHHMFAFTHALS